MSRLDELLQQYCPNGVEYKPLKSVSIMQRGTSITKAQARDGIYPVISGGREPAFYCDTYNRDGETVTVAGSGAGAGYVQYFNEPLFANDCFTIKGLAGISTKYLYYCMSWMQERISGTKKGGGVPHVHISNIDRFEIPVPPLPVQQEIVRILDKFTELEAELEAELERRKAQYEWYRDQLLTFRRDGGPDVPLLPWLQKLLDRYVPNGVEWKAIDDVFDIRNGYTPSKNVAEYWTDGVIPWYRMEDIRQNGRILSDSIQHISESAIKNGKLFKSNSIILATTATIGEHAMLIADSLANQQFTNFAICELLSDKLLSKYVFYYFFKIDEWCKNNVKVGNFAAVDVDKLKKQLFPIPPLEVQEVIVSVLDNFSTLVTDISSGLPAEIAARHKQYEYYRGKLLAFERA